MKTKQNRSRSDPRLVSTQISIRVPYHYREQLQREAEKRGQLITEMVVETLQRVFPVKAPPIQRIDDEADG